MGQGERKIRHRLRRYAASCREICPEEKEKRIGELLEHLGRKCLQVEPPEHLERESPQAEPPEHLEKECPQTEPPERTRGSLWDFVWEQIGYLGRYCLFWQAVWAVFFLCLLRSGIPSLLLSVSLLPPLLVLLTVEEVTKVYQRSMLEIEYATKYSLRSVVLLRMLVLCGIHSVLVFVCILCLREDASPGLARLLVYGFTPMLLMTWGLLKLMQYCQGDLLRKGAVGMYVLSVAAAFLTEIGAFGWYAPACFRIWGIVCAVGAAAVVREFVRLCRNLECFEKIAGVE